MKRSTFVVVCSLLGVVSLMLVQQAEDPTSALAATAVPPMVTAIGTTAVLTACASAAGVLWAAAGWLRDRGEDGRSNKPGSHMLEQTLSQSTGRSLSGFDGLLLGLGTLFLFGGVVVWQVPSLVPPEAQTLADIPFEAFTQLLLGFGGLIGLVVLGVSTFGSRNQIQRLLGAIDPPEEIRLDDRPLVGEDFDRLLADIDRRDRGRHRPEELQSETYEILTDIATEAIATSYDCHHEAAREMLAHGTWTDNRAVSAFMTQVDPPKAPFLVRFLDWVSAESAFVRRTKRTIAELDRLVEEGCR